LLAAILPGEDFTLDVHSVIFGKSTRAEPTSFYGNMRNFYFNGERLFDHMPPDTLVDPYTTAPTLPPDSHLWREYDGYSWVWYDLERLPSSYHRRNHRESFEVVFRTRRPDGLIWYTGNEHNNMHLTLKVSLSLWIHSFNDKIDDIVVVIVKYTENIKHLLGCVVVLSAACLLRIICPRSGEMGRWEYIQLQQQGYVSNVCPATSFQVNMMMMMIIIIVASYVNMPLATQPDTSLSVMLSAGRLLLLASQPRRSRLASSEVMANTWMV